jgi:O-acetyl-ADP-ribose deacetylase (regulator of RNase III)
MSAAIRYVVGDATAPVAECGTPVFIVHVCNDQGGWGSGFVVAVSKRWSGPEAAYRRWVRDAKSGVGSAFELGMVQLVSVEPDVAVVNMVAQHRFKSVTNPVAVRYDALRTCLAKVAKAAVEVGATVAMPRIGCGLAGGVWSEVESIINDTLIGAGVGVVVFDLA